MRVNEPFRVAAALLLVLAGGAAAEDPPAPPRTAEAPPPVPDEPAPEPAPALVPTPPGSPEDQALWKATLDIGNQLTAVRVEGARLHWKIRNEELHARLEALTRKEPDRAKEIEAVRSELLAAQVASYGDLQGRWPLDKTRACQYPNSLLGSTMIVAAERSVPGELGQVRDAASRCLDVGRATLARVSRSNAALAAAVEKAGQTVGPMAPNTGR